MQQLDVGNIDTYSVVLGKAGRKDGLVRDLMYVELS